MMDRRTFLARLGFGTVAAAAAANGLIDLERLLWVRGEKTIFLPPAVSPLVDSFTAGDIFTIDGLFTLNPVSRRSTTHLQQFVITQTSESGITLMVDRVHPPIITSGAYANVSMVGSPVVKGQIDGKRVQPLWVGR